jgi:hypothetical protein
VQTGRHGLRRSTVRVACVIVAAVAVLAVAELTSERFNEFIRDHSLISTFIAEAILLVGVYLVIDDIIQRRETGRWSDVTWLGIRALSAAAQRPAEVIRRSVDQLCAETGSSPGSPVDYQELVSARADELGDWLRADEGRARSFAEETRQSASRLEDAIVRWGPTLVEDPDSAELLNLLPDIVDSARAAAQAISPAPGWLDRMRGRAGGWTDDDRLGFEQSLLEVLKKSDEFERRRSSR